MKLVRGYIFSRPFMEQRVPQHVQNLVVRDYCQKRGLQYLLSVTEYAIPNCYLMLGKALQELPELDGIVIYSLFQLPEDSLQRGKTIQTVLDQGKSLHFAVEGLQLFDSADSTRIETIWQVQQTLPYCLADHSF